MHVSATDIKNKLGEYLRICTRQDVVITKHGREIAVLKGLEGGFMVREDSTVYELADRERSLGRMTYREFKEFTKNNDEQYELIDGYVYRMESPKVSHQYTLSRISGIFHNWFEDKKCIPFFAPFDITLNLQRENPDVVQPDLVVICDLEDHMNETGYYMGIPKLVIEILSHSTKRKDMITKLNLYMLSGVCEYWVVDTDSKEIMVFRFNNKDIADSKTYISGMTCRSFIFDGLTVEIDRIFM